MTTKPTRIIDPHIHLWDPANTDWYPYLQGSRWAGSGDVTRMNRRFDEATYRAESTGWNVEKVVNVAAATGGYSVDETFAIDELASATGFPAAIVGGLPPTDTVGEAIELLDRQMTVDRLRGVRVMGRSVGPVPEPELLAALSDRGLVLDLLARPDTLRSSAERLASAPDLVTVVEHAGWPRSDSDEERALRDDGLKALADVGPNVVCKISGLTMPLAMMDAEVVRPWIERCIDLFGSDRCMFASNFPVDSVHGTFDDLYTGFATVTQGLDEGARDELFAGTAERIYRL